MNNSDVTNTIKAAIPGTPENRIYRYKSFFKTHLTKVKRKEALGSLYPIILEFQKAEPIAPILSNNNEIALIAKAESTLNQYFTKEIITLFQKKGTSVEPKIEISDDGPILLNFLSIISGSLNATNETFKHNWQYKTQFLIFLHNCLYEYGLHNEIQQRNSEDFKRFNIVIHHNFKSKTEICDYKILISGEILNREIFKPYEKKLPIRLNGKLITFDSIHKLQVTSTLLQNDEIELFALKHNFRWNEKFKDELIFINQCHDETDNFHKNPYLIEENEQFRNQNTCFIHPDRIVEIKALKSDNFDLLKLVEMLEELNITSLTKSHIATSLLVRGIIDHIPPIFGFKNFAEVANNYSGGTQSFKKAMGNLDKSLRNIADNNIHSQARSKEVLPTTNQIDFTPELDLLLSEIVRILK